ncbi:hypothetical protein JHW43_007413 [Diplocarpon mali]|nr:hypothetical protein JHW43_007413 [Diplocarpon mali]
MIFSLVRAFALLLILQHSHVQAQSTVFQTQVFTITSCAPEVTDCPARTMTSTFIEQPITTTPPYACNSELETCPNPVSSTIEPESTTPACDYEDGECAPGPETTLSAPEVASISTSSTISTSTASTADAVTSLSGSTEISSAAETPAPVTTLHSTLFTTLVQTITSCAPTVTNCPYGSITTHTIPLPPPTNALMYETTYTTAYVDICPTGLTTHTYTLTHKCTAAACQIPTTVPTNFAVTTKVCSACEGKPTLTVTCPVETGKWSNGTATAPGHVSPPKETGMGNATGPVYLTAGAERVAAGIWTGLVVLGIALGGVGWGW